MAGKRLTIWAGQEREFLFRPEGEHLIIMYWPG